MDDRSSSTSTAVATPREPTNSIRSTMSFSTTRWNTITSASVGKSASTAWPCWLRQPEPGRVMAVGNHGHVVAGGGEEFAGPAAPERAAGPGVGGVDVRFHGQTLWPATATPSHQGKLPFLVAGDEVVSVLEHPQPPPHVIGVTAPPEQDQ